MYLPCSMLKSKDGIIFSMWDVSQMFSTSSSDTVFLTTLCVQTGKIKFWRREQILLILWTLLHTFSPWMPAFRISFRNSSLEELLWHIEANFETKKSYRRWYDGVSSSIYANLTNWNWKKEQFHEFQTNQLSSRVSYGHLLTDFVANICKFGSGDSSSFCTIFKKLSTNKFNVWEWQACSSWSMHSTPITVNLQETNKTKSKTFLIN